MQTESLILTLKLDEKSQTLFNAQRTRYFLPEQNILDAHLTLFHQLPPEPATFDFFKNLRYKLFPIDITGLMNLGSGLAYRVESTTLLTLHKVIGKQFHNILIPQDRQGFRPHITIMNKSTPETARALMVELQKNFYPFAVTATGLELFTYLSGPWHHEQTFLFV